MHAGRVQGAAVFQLPRGAVQQHALVENVGPRGGRVDFIAAARRRLTLDLVAAYMLRAWVDKPRRDWERSSRELHQGLELQQMREDLRRVRGLVAMVLVGAPRAPGARRVDHALLAADLLLHLLWLPFSSLSAVQDSAGAGRRRGYCARREGGAGRRDLGRGCRRFQQRCPLACGQEEGDLGCASTGAPCKR